MAKSLIQLFVGDFTTSPPTTVLLGMDKDISVPMDVKIADVRDVQKRGSGFTQEWTLPGTPTNNKFFGGMYDINANFSIFNPNLRTACQYSLDGDLILDGYLQLKKVRRKRNGDIIYLVTLFDLTGGFFQSLRGKKLVDLDWSDLDHVLDIDNVKNGWENEWDLNHLGLEGVSDGDNGGFTYPLMKDDAYLQPRPIEHFQAAVFYKRALDKLVRQAHPDFPAQEFTWSGNLFDDVQFERAILPYTGDKPKVSEAVAASKAMFVGRSTDFTMHTHNDPTGFLAFLFNVFFVPFNDESTVPFDDSNGLWDGNNFTAPVTGLYKFNMNIGVDVEVDYTVDDTAIGFLPVDRELSGTQELYNSN